MTVPKKLLVLGSQTFLTSAPRVGIQVIAEGLAGRGHEVHYVSAPSSPLDLLSKTRRARFNYGWTKPGVYKVRQNLYEHVVKTPFPINRKVWLRREQYGLYSRLLPRRLTDASFALCIHDTSPTYPFLERIEANTLVLRLNDQPEGFSFHVPDVVTEQLLKNLAQDRYAEIWSVSSALTRYAQDKAPETPVVTLPNGVDLGRFSSVTPQPTPRTATFVGAIEKWVDLTLLREVAARLPEWQFDLYGPLSTPLPEVPNLSYKGVLDFDDVAKTLARYQVGLIPFGHSELIEVMERPLKFYEYLAAGLGIASTKVGDLQSGMGDWAHFGATPAEFADAVLKAAEDAGTRAQERRAYLASYSWESILEEMVGRLEALW